MAESWKTYEELARLHHISLQAARHLVRRRRWRVQVGNDRRVRVLVPDDVPIRLRAPARAATWTPVHTEDSNRISELQTLLMAMTERAARAEGSAEELRREIGEVRARLATAEEGVRVAEAQTAAHQAEVATLRAAEQEMRARLATAETGAKAAEAALAKQRAEAAERATWGRWRRLRAAWRRRQ